MSLSTVERRARDAEPCPKCSVGVGADCLNGHREPMDYLHPSRLRAYRAAHPKGRPAREPTSVLSYRVPARLREALDTAIRAIIAQHMG